MQVERYMGRISGPLLDRIDMHIEVPAVPYQELAARQDGTSSKTMREQVLRARAVQARTRATAARALAASAPAPPSGWAATAVCYSGFPEGTGMPDPGRALAYRQSLAGSGLTSLSCSAVAPTLRLPAPGLVTSTSAPVSST